MKYLLLPLFPFVCLWAFIRQVRACLALCLVLMVVGGAYGGQNSYGRTGIWRLSHFNEGSGTLTTSYSGSAFTNYTIANFSWTTGKYGTAITGNGSNSTALLATTDAMGGGPLTISAWLKFPSTLSASADAIVCKNPTTTANAADYVLFFKKLSGYATPWLQWTDTDAVGNNSATSTFNYTDKWDTWFFMTVVYTPTRVRWYKNGVFVNEQTHTTAGKTRRGTTTNLYVGVQRAASAYYWYTRASIDELRIANVLLTDQQVKKLYADAVGRGYAR